MYACITVSDFRTVKIEQFLRVCAYIVCVNSYSISIILHCTGAVHRFYESRRRLFLDFQPERVDEAKRTHQNSKNTAL